MLILKRTKTQMMTTFNILALLTVLHITQALVPYGTWCPDGHYCPTINYGAIDPDAKPIPPGWTFGLTFLRGVGPGMSIFPDVDTYEGTFAITGDGKAPINTEMKLGCTNKLNGPYANKMAHAFGYQWDDTCITSSLPVSVNRALDVNNFTLDQVTSDRAPVEKAIYSEMLNHTRAIGCHPGDWFELISCNIITVNHNKDLTRMFEEKVLEEHRGQLLDLKHDNAKKEQFTLSTVADSSNERTIDKAQADAKASAIKNAESLNNTKATNQEERDHMTYMAEMLGPHFDSTMWSNAIREGQSIVALPFGPASESPVGINVHHHTANITA